MKVTFLASENIDSLPIDELKQRLISSGFSINNIHVCEKDEPSFSSAVEVDLIRYKKIDEDFNALTKLYRSFCSIIGNGKLLVEKCEINDLNSYINSNSIFCGSGVRSYLQYTDRGTILKVYDKKYTEYLKREISTRELLKNMDEVIPLVASGKDFIEMHCHEFAWKWNDNGLRLYPLKKAINNMKILQEIYKNGVCLSDCNPDTFLYSNDGVYLIDFEYAYKHDLKDIPFEDSPDITGEGHKHELAGVYVRSYANTWKPIFGLELHELMSDNPLWLLQLQRFKYWLFKRAPHWLIKQIEKKIRALRDIILPKYIVESQDDVICISKR
jgi:hypothetical protein